MKTLVIYDSLYGNTKIVAQAIADSIPDEVEMAHVNEVPDLNLSNYDLLIIGGPTHGGGPSDTMKGMLESLDPSSVSGAQVAAFDTRITWWWVRPFGYAAPKIARRLEKMGAEILAEGEGFFVTGGEGPLKEGELDRAAAWAQEIATLAAATLAPLQV